MRFLNESHPFQYGLFFNYKSDYLIHFTSTHQFVKTIFNAQCFNRYINLQCCNFIFFLNNTKFIDWVATWNRFKNCSPLPQSYTSFKKSIHMAFSSKFMLNELLFLYKLQTAR